MKAQVLREESGPGGLELVEVDDLTAGPGQYLVDIKACGVCFPDLLMSRGLYQMRPPLPFTPGTEVAGVVREAPEGGKYKVGDKVLVFSGVGGFAEQTVAFEPQILPQPEGLTFAEGAAMGINFQTAIFALKLRAHTAPGEVVAVLGAAGGVGAASIRVAKEMGAKVIAVVHRKGAEQMLRDAGPWGQMFPEPLFDGHFRLLQQRLVGERHLKVMVEPVGGGPLLDGIAFNVDTTCWPDNGVREVQLAYKLDINEFRGNRSLQIIIDNIWPL